MALMNAVKAAEPGLDLDTASDAEIERVTGSNATAARAHSELLVFRATNSYGILHRILFDLIELQDRIETVDWESQSREEHLQIVDEIVEMLDSIRGVVCGDSCAAD